MINSGRGECPVGVVWSLLSSGRPSLKKEEDSCRNDGGVRCTYGLVFSEFSQCFYILGT